MKINKILFIVLIIIFSYTCSAIEPISLKLECENDYCVPGRVTEFNFSIKYEGKDSLSILGYRIIDAITGKDIYSNIEENPQTIYPQLSYINSVRKEIPPANVGDKLILHSCITSVPDMDSWGKAGRSIVYCYNDLNLTFNITECLENSDCKDDSTCIDKKCVKLNCSYCEYTKNHECNKYQCCKNIECNKEESCINHECSKLSCLEDEYIINNTCTKTVCRPEEGIIDYSCVTLNCNFDEYITNHECVSLDCKDNEGFFNHTCQEFNCSYNKYALNHTCTKLNCTNKQGYFNNSCFNLKCGIFKLAEEHECRINSYLIIYPFLIFMIYFLVKINIQKYKYIKTKKIINIFFNKKDNDNKKQEDIKTPEKKDSKVTKK
jgi:hypothetical protein